MSALIFLLYLDITVPIPHCFLLILANEIYQIVRLFGLTGHLANYNLDLLVGINNNIYCVGWRVN